MRRAELLLKLRELRPWLESQGVAKVYVFGSYARDEAELDSDVDLLVAFAPGQTPDLFAFAGIKLELEARLGRRVDLLTQGGLHPALRSRIERTLIDA